MSGALGFLAVFCFRTAASHRVSPCSTRHHVLRRGQGQDKPATKSRPLPLQRPSPLLPSAKDLASPRNDPISYHHLGTVFQTLFVLGIQDVDVRGFGETGRG
ncbi:hypothetical protein CIHG_07360 [Coccidioides immitis H538.4]|uniref:Secreted protein n=3 Tax=Coccidioides immitis TaxID=5501 RepID=A0A0J8QTZ3_COCIT|nr:hypothetical protein CIRG_00690 [Coccidioides immitis RMSCC 2394]KMU75931.1 hypothetical protein CISG_05416 [Coccidioides immitis RMSCC 3703]KMU89553.1 hypothetical protein CIHG_07360 [Coccidioides immitis H538.4]